MEIKKHLQQKTKNKEKILFCGIGNDIKGDDAVGPYIINELETTDKIKTINCGKNPENHIRKIVEINPDLLILVDSTRFDRDPGDIVISKPKEIKKTQVSSHKMPIKIFIEILNDRIENLETILIGIQPKKIVLGNKITPEIKETADKLIEIIDNLEEK